MVFPSPGPYTGHGRVPGVGNSLSVVQPTPARGGARLVIRNNPQTDSFEASFAPRKVSYSGFEAVYNETTRPDRKPLVTRSGYSLRKMSMELFIGSTDPLEVQNDKLNSLERLARSLTPILVEYDKQTAGDWRITALSYDSMERHPTTDEITRATATIEFTEITDKSDITLNVAAKQRPKKVRVREGETMAQIAMRYYGTTSSFIINAIAKANDIDDLRNLPKRITLP